MMTQEAFLDSVDQDQTVQNMQSDIWSTLATFIILDYNLTVSSWNGSTFLADERAWLLYSSVKKLIMPPRINRLEAVFALFVCLSVLLLQKL